MKKKRQSAETKKEIRLKINPLAVYQILSLRGKVRTKVEKLSDVLRRKYG
ncbi:MAG: hypothetical protein HQM15_05180 [Deltaproteobacteria bacterium]|nr:hypothetical protein [Deltaproteobacteria bacterium]